MKKLNGLQNFPIDFLDIDNFMFEQIVMYLHKNFDIFDI